jgi:hypothetical protein
MLLERYINGLQLIFIMSFCSPILQSNFRSIDKSYGSWHSRQWYYRDSAATSKMLSIALAVDELYAALA